jgi:hypothetical protein
MVKKLSKKILKHNPMHSVAKVLESPNVRYTLIVLLIVYSGLLVPSFDQRISPLFDSWVVRTVFLLTILAVLPQDPLLGGFLILAFGVSMFVNYNNNTMQTMLEEEDDNRNTGNLSRKVASSVDSVGQVVSKPLGAVVDVSGQAVRGAVGLTGNVLSSADSVTGGVVGGVVRGTDRVARGILSDVAGGLGRTSVDEPSGFNIGYKQCVNGKGNGLCKGVGNVGLQTQGLGVPVGNPGEEIGATY